VKAVHKLLGAFVVALLAFGPVAACSSSSSTTTTTPEAGGGDDAGHTGFPDAANSTCGHPGDKGNSLGVGKFCQSSADCANNTQATLCAIIGDDRSFFCTFLCDEDGGVNQCGENAECACQGACGCFPIACDDSADAGDAGSDAPNDAPDGG
jgi:hypothetical protein